MLLSSPEQIEHYHANGLWQEARLDQVFHAHVQDRADDVAFVDDPALFKITGREPQCLTFIQVQEQVAKLAAVLSNVGVKTDQVVGVLLPPSVDAALLVMVASKLGFILAPLPLTMREGDLQAGLEAIGAKAVICCRHYEDEPVAERVRNVAAEMFSIRYVFCVGDNAPDGLIGLDAMLAEVSQAEDMDGEDGKTGPSADAVLAIHWTCASSRPSKPVGRSHNQLLSVGRHLSEQMDLKSGDCIFATHHLSGLIGFAGGLIAAIWSGARIQFHQFTGFSHLSRSLEEFGGQHVFLPGKYWSILHDILPGSVREQLSSVSLCWNRKHSTKELFRANESAARLLDLTNFGELALFSQIRREPGKIGAVPLGDIKSLTLDGDDAFWLESRLYGMEEARQRFDEAILGGELCLKGPMVPEKSFPVAGAHDGVALPADANGFIHTDIGCRVVEETEHGMLFSPLGDLGDVIGIGAQVERGEDLDALYASCDGVTDAACFLMDDEDAGNKTLMAALVCDDRVNGAASLFAFLETQKVSAHKIPKGTIYVDAIPRQTNGAVMRDRLIEAADISAVA